MVLTGQTEYEIGRKNPEVPSKFLNVYDFGKKVHLSANHRGGGEKDIPRVLASTEIITVVVFTAGQRLVLWFWLALMLFLFSNCLIGQF